MSKTVVFTEQSLYTSILEGYIYDLNSIVTDRKIINVNIDDICYIFSLNNKDRKLEEQTLIIYRDINELKEYKDEDLSLIFQRIHKFSHDIHRNKKSMPRKWSSYHYNNRVSFSAFDYPRANFHLITEIRQIENKNCLYIEGILECKNQLKLDECELSSIEFNKAVKNIKKASEQYKIDLEKVKINQMEDNLLFEKSVMSEDNLYSYDEWLRKLSIVQQRFVDINSTHAIKLRGPAGTGKTLAMEMKVLKLLREKTELKILYLTHSWAVAEQVQDFIDLTVDELDNLDRIDVYPLLSFAEMFIEKNKNIVILGEDSFSGKLLQLEIIAEIVDEYYSENRIILDNTLSSLVLNRIKSNDENSRKVFFWDLMLEFACVIGANGIMPGLSAKDQYKGIERRPWMMHLENAADQDFIITIYQQYIKYLVNKSEITSDQMINDFLNYLSTYNWYYDRTKKGYDYIFVDEMQLFNEQERMVFHFLTKSPDEYPKLFLAIDPKQAVMETFFDGISSHLGERLEDQSSETTFGQSEDIVLGDVFRYTPEILEFLKHIDKSYPALGLIQDWNNNLARSNSKRNRGEIPSLMIFNNEKDKIAYGIKHAEKSSSKGSKTAILIMDNKEYMEFKKTNKLHNTEYVESKEDTLKLKYKKRALVVSQPSYVIGLQFDVVIILGCSIHFNEHDPNQSYNMRRYISDLYLGCSRASKELYLVGNSKKGTIPSFIENSIEKKLLKKD